MSRTAIHPLEESYRRLLLLKSIGLEIHETDFYTALAQQLRDVEREFDLADARFAPSDLR